MDRFLQYAKMKFDVDWRLILMYCLVYLLWGMGMNWLGTTLEIARFTYWWQVITTYILYMVPISLLLRNRPFYEQYAYGLIAMGLLEFGGYAMRTSYAYPNNLLDQFFGGRTFALAMALFFALYFPAGNWLVGTLYKLMFNRKP
ncbi:hypothetical protein [Maribacter cobaltidurans]|uniref:Uncharacterized protein n=1 Tax=Maribacter cobaltidurans TaxID=1178778 RepID=A0A223V9K2_9FLAO|nr:hypothetical protein [Maribacter cobaltidurans]ASV32075.1 hypothetical protein CJ263_18660 [Maribacter cobaltidurans]GGD87039.1 hypothetical protein GCM10011412_26080 [Maribacter cobaltidurans]